MLRGRVSHLGRGYALWATLFKMAEARALCAMPRKICALEVRRTPSVDLAQACHIVCAILGRASHTLQHLPRINGGRYGALACETRIATGSGLRSLIQGTGIVLIGCEVWPRGANRDSMMDHNNAVDHPRSAYRQAARRSQECLLTLLCLLRRYISKYPRGSFGPRATIADLLFTLRYR